MIQAPLYNIRNRLQELLQLHEIMFKSIGELEEYTVNEYISVENVEINYELENICKSVKRKVSLKYQMNTETEFSSSSN